MEDRGIVSKGSWQVWSEKSARIMGTKLSMGSMPLCLSLDHIFTVTSLNDKRSLSKLIHKLCQFVYKIILIVCIYNNTIQQISYYMWYMILINTTLFLIIRKLKLAINTEQVYISVKCHQKSCMQCLHFIHKNCLFLKHKLALPLHLKNIKLVWKYTIFILHSIWLVLISLPIECSCQEQEYLWIVVNYGLLRHSLIISIKSALNELTYMIG